MIPLLYPPELHRHAYVVDRVYPDPRAPERTRTADPFLTMEVLYRLSYRGIFRLCGGGRIRTSVGEAGRFTVCSLWPLGHTPGHAPVSAPERPIMVANAADFSTEPGKGFEPPTCRLQGGCSTAELPGHKSHQLLASRLATVTRLATAILAGGSAA